MAMKKRALKMPRAGSLARAVGDKLLAQVGKKAAWWFPKTLQETRAIRHLRSIGWPVEDFNPVGVSGKNTYRLDPERMKRYSA